MDKKSKMMESKKISITDCSKHETKRNILKRYLFIVMILAIYLAFSVIELGLSNGILVTFLTWSLFVLCTPIADAGFLLDFPIRLFTRLRMIHSELIVWTIALSMNFFVLLFYPGVYAKTFLLHLFKIILTTPFPYWLIIIISAMGTFLSIYFADELMDVATHKERKKQNKHKRKYLLIILFFLITLIFLLYHYLLNNLGVKL